ARFPSPRYRRAEGFELDSARLRRHRAARLQPRSSQALRPGTPLGGRAPRRLENGARWEHLTAMAEGLPLTRAACRCSQKDGTADDLGRPAVGTKEIRQKN